MKKQILSFILSLTLLPTFAQSLESNVEERLQHFFSEYKPLSTNIGICKLESYQLDNDNRRLHIFPSKSFGYQSFTSENVKQIYNYLKSHLPGPVNYYDITIYADGKPIEELIPNFLRKKKDESRLWKREYKGEAYAIQRGSEGDICKREYRLHRYRAAIGMQDFTPLSS